MERQQLIEAVLPTVQHLFGDTAENVRKGLERMDTTELEKMYQRTRVPEGISQAARTAVANTPEYLENLKLRQQMELTNALRICFGTKVPEAGNRTVADNEANRRTLTEWLLAETDVIPNVQQWFLGLFKNDPSLAKTDYGLLIWNNLPTPIAKQKADQQAQHAKDWQTFIDFCRTSGEISASHANFNVVIQALGSPLRYQELTTLLVDLPNGYGGSGPALLLDSGDTVELAPQSRAEQEQFRQERVQLDQAHLRDLRDSNNIAALLARSRRDHDSGQPSFYDRNIQTDPGLTQEFNLSQGYERDVVNGQYKTPLPTHWLGKELTPELIRAMTLDGTIHPLFQRFGTARINARLLGFKKVRRFDSVGTPLAGAPEYVFERE